MPRQSGGRLLRLWIAENPVSGHRSDQRSGAVLSADEEAAAGAVLGARREHRQACRARALAARQLIANPCAHPGLFRQILNPLLFHRFLREVGILARDREPQGCASSATFAGWRAHDLRGDASRCEQRLRLLERGHRSLRDHHARSGRGGGGGIALHGRSP